MKRNASAWIIDQFKNKGKRTHKQQVFITLQITAGIPQ